MRNLYKVLGIATSADDRRIKSAFRRRAMRTHPDLNPGSTDAEQQFRELLQAYEVLRNAHARALYDAHLTQRRRDAWRRFAHSAAVMVATFLLTTSSAIFVLGQQGISVHSETWQIATAWLTSVEVEPAAAHRSVGAGVVHPAPVAARPPASERSRKREIETAAAAQKRVTIAPRTAPANERRTSPVPAASAADGQQGRSWPPAAAEPFYSLGASDLR